jgi:hypothetical protein
VYDAWGSEKYKIPVGKPEGKRPFGEPGHRWRILLDVLEK